MWVLGFAQPQPPLPPFRPGENLGLHCWSCELLWWFLVLWRKRRCLWCNAPTRKFNPPYLVQFMDSCKSLISYHLCLGMLYQGFYAFSPCLGDFEWIDSTKLSTLWILEVPLSFSASYLSNGWVFVPCVRLWPRFHNIWHNQVHEMHLHKAGVFMKFMNVRKLSGRDESVA